MPNTMHVKQQRLEAALFQLAPPNLCVSTLVDQRISPATTPRAPRRTPAEAARTEPAPLVALGDVAADVELAGEDELCDPDGEAESDEPEGAAESEAAGADEEPAGADEEPAGAAEDAVALLPPMAVAWKVAKDLSAVGFTAKTMPLWQWFLGLGEEVSNDSHGGRSR